MASDDIEITAEEARRLVDAGEAQLVDVREQREWDAGRIPGARHVALGELSEQAATLDTDRPVVFQCLAGGRSLMAAQAFRASGVEAYSLAGGIRAWADAGLPVDGEIASH